MGVLRLMVDRTASRYAGLRSASLRKRPGGESNESHQLMRRHQTVLFHRRGAASFNKPAAGNAGIASRLAIEHRRPGVPEPERSATAFARRT